MNVLKTAAGTTLGCLICLLPVAALFALFAWLSPDGPARQAPIGTPTSTSTETGGMPALIDDPSQPDWMIQGFWYCWNIEPATPHHLDHHVPGDHLCTWGELRDSGFAYMP